MHAKEAEMNKIQAKSQVSEIFKLKGCFFFKLLLNSFLNLDKSWDCLAKLTCKK